MFNYIITHLKILAYVVVTLIVLIFMNQTINTGAYDNMNPVMSKQTELEIYLNKLSARESGNNKTVVNAYGMMGKYQFSASTLRRIRPDVTKERFLRDPYIQDTIMIIYLRRNNEDLRGIIRAYSGKMFKGIRITQSGILAAAHLGGSGSVIAWFNSPEDDEGRTDANGTSIKQYMKEFSNFNIGKFL